MNCTHDSAKNDDNNIIIIIMCTLPGLGCCSGVEWPADGCESSDAPARVVKPYEIKYNIICKYNT